MTLPSPGADRAAIVTGASQGIGAELARELSRRGHRVVLVARNEDKLDELAEEIATSGRRADVLPTDLADRSARATLLDREKLGLNFEVYATLKLSLPTKENLDAFEAAVRTFPEVVQCATVTGEADYVMRIITRDMHAFDEFLREKVLSLGVVANVQSRIVMRSVKNSTAIPLGLVNPHLTGDPA